MDVSRMSCQNVEKISKACQCKFPKITAPEQSLLVDVGDNTVACVTKAPVQTPVEATASAYFNKQ